MNLPPKILKKLILDTGLVSEEDFDNVVQEAQRTEKNIVDLLISRNFITGDFYADILSKYLNVPRVKLSGQKIDPNILNILPEEISRTRNVAVFSKEDNSLHVAMLDPSNLETLDFLNKYTGYFIKPYLCLEEDLKFVFAQYGKEVSKDFQKTIQESIRSSLKLTGIEAEKAATEFPIVSLTDNIISYAASLGTTDIHIEPLGDEILIRFRVDGVLKEIIRLAKEIHPAIVARVKILSNLLIDEHNKPQDGRLKYKYADTIFDIRVSIMPTLYGEKVEMRLLTGSTKPMSFQELGMAEETIKVLEDNITKTTGMILVTGPTGSGKTTTLYAILNKLNRPEVNIVTIEDPIEYELRYVNQTQTNPKAGINFANGLRSILRQDPDIIMVGEIRDKETAEIAIHAALTGHLVLSTLHTNDAATAVPRLVDMDIPPFLVSATVNLVIAQRLVRKICRDCIESYQVPESVNKIVNDQLTLLKGETASSHHLKQLYRGKGCKACNNTGYRGRLAIYEVFNVNEKVRSYIQKDDFSLDGLRKIAFAQGTKTMFEDGLKKAELGQTTIEEVLRVIKE
ncbi:MAG: GspE/PulE family protein [Candidatus Pacebacteria bacterium]|jgi:type IV pilus assembly protein PilB|nr:GspE/PulE family protein [Candidatus Paceibacterota bacterium]MDD5535449.1 GspE/PulE family protein [Candidatus Paceibacterota bacterium]